MDEDRRWSLFSSVVYVCANPLVAPSTDTIGTIPMDGEPTSVAVHGNFAVVAVNTSEDYINTSGELKILNIAEAAIVRSIVLGGQPDSVAFR